MSAILTVPMEAPGAVCQNHKRLFPSLEQGDLLLSVQDQYPQHHTSQNDQRLKHRFPHRL